MAPEIHFHREFNEGFHVLEWNVAHAGEPVHFAERVATALSRQDFEITLVKEEGLITFSNPISDGEVNRFFEALLEQKAIEDYPPGEGP